LDFAKTNSVDVFVLDIQLKSTMSGIELAEKIRAFNKDSYIIFTAGHLEYSLLAYKLKTFDYIPKPITLERLEETVLRLVDDINGTPKKYIKIDNKNTLVDESEILYIKREGMKLIYHTTTKDYDTYSSFAKMDSLLPINFVRCHKSFVVNLNRIIHVEPVSNMIYFNDNSSCEIGPKYKREILEVLTDYGNIK
jgi:DNA-binding LytR/AlgR family response regulator